MKRLLFAAVVVSLLPVSAGAQFFPDPFEERRRFEEPRRDWRDDRREWRQDRYQDRRDWREDRFERRGFDERRRFDEPAPRRANTANVCETSRGNCAVARGTPIGANCRCNIPGFGPKRGNAQLY